jgi:hypothetical protein
VEATWKPGGCARGIKILYLFEVRVVKRNEFKLQAISLHFLRLQHISTFVLQTLTASIDPNMCRVHDVTTPDNARNPRTAVRVPWPIVFSGFYGGHITLCLSFCCVLFAMAMSQVFMYVRSVLNYPNIICLPRSFAIWTIAIPIMLLLWFLVTICSFWFCLGRKWAWSDEWGAFGMRLNDLFVGAFLGTFLYILFTTPGGLEGIIIKHDNDSDIMFQYLPRLEGGFDVYTIFPRYYDLKKIYSSYSCIGLPFSHICSVFSPLQSPANFSEVWQCQYGVGQGPKPTFLHSEPLLDFSHTAAYLGIAFTIFFGSGHWLLIRQRFPRPTR